MRNTFIEDKQAFWATYKTRWGWISFILGNLIYGYIVLNYVHTIEEYVLDRISFLPQSIITPFSWILLGIALSIGGYIILLIVEKIVSLSGIKNKKIF